MDPLTVSIVDDDQQLRILLHMLLTAEGFAIADEAESAEDFLARWADKPADVIVVDYRLPGQNGLDLAQTILAEQPDVSVVLLSAYATPDIVADCHRLGLRACVAKDEINLLPDLLHQWQADR